jgi:hypothetical protein
MKAPAFIPGERLAQQAVKMSAKPAPAAHAVMDASQVQPPMLIQGVLSCLLSPHAGKPVFLPARPPAFLGQC